MNAVNIRDYTADRHKKVDDYPYGRGAMLIQAQPVYDAWKAACEEIQGQQPEELQDRPVRTVYVTPQGSRVQPADGKGSSRRRKILFSCAGTIRGSTSVY